jgi:hypothetical protein
MTGKLPAGTKRLRLSQAFELYWDRIALFEKRAAQDTRTIALLPTKADLHWRGFSEYAEMRELPLFLPDYSRLIQNPAWQITPAGWCTQYGAVEALIHEKDNAIALINGGDELTLAFAADKFPSKEPGMKRDFFLFAVGWDKDSDFYVAEGTDVNPLPWHGMDSQQYGKQLRPVFPSDSLMEKQNTRWVGPYTLRRANKR